jgi:DtxR family Mn-dependent transcriptional regulator
LTDVVGLAWHKVHAEADRWEHVISDEVEERLVIILGNPAVCPHGNAIPGSGIAPEPSTLLVEAHVGDRVRLTRVLEMVEFDMEALCYLEKHNFIPGREATVAAQGPDGSMVLEVDGNTVVLGASLAKRLCVSPAGAAVQETSATYPATVAAG